MHIGQNLSDSWTTYQTTTVDEYVAFDVPFVCMDSGNPAVDGGYRFDPDFLAYPDTCYEKNQVWIGLHGAAMQLYSSRFIYTARPQLTVWIGLHGAAIQLYSSRFIYTARPQLTVWIGLPGAAIYTAIQFQVHLYSQATTNSLNRPPWSSYTALGSSVQPGHN